MSKLSEEESFTTDTSVSLYALPEENVNPVNVSRIKSDRMGRLRVYILECQEIIWHLGWSSHFTSPLKT
jgi:hypothetical protein